MKLVILISAIFFLGCKVSLLSSLSEADANYVLLYLRKAGVSAEKVGKNSKFEIKVPESQVTLALEVINKIKIYSHDNSFKKNAKSSKEEENFYLERLLAKELEETIRNLPGVKIARVHLFSPKYDSLALKKLELDNSKAAALVITSKIDEIEPEKIKTIISGASGIPESKIQVNIMFSPDLEFENLSNSAPISRFFTFSISHFFTLVALFFGCFGLYYVFRRTPKI